MANLITLSISEEDKSYLKSHHVKKSQLFRTALFLEKRKSEFFNILHIRDYYTMILEYQTKLTKLMNEIKIRNERIESLQDVLANKELDEQGIRDSNKADTNTRG